MLIDRRERKITVCDVTCAWEPLVLEREQEKRRKYRELAADLAGQWRGYKCSCGGNVGGGVWAGRKSEEAGGLQWEGERHW